MERVKFCLPVIVENFSDVIATIKAAESKYDYFEIWLDYLSDFNLGTLEVLLEEYGNRLILLFRRQKLETIQMPLGDRFKVMKLAEKYGALVDLDMVTQVAELEHADVKQIGILSYHNYQETPDTDFLRSLLEKMRDYKPQIYKFSCFCKSREDAVRLLEFQRETEIRGFKSIVLGMGKKAMITRIFGPLWGAAFTFAPEIQGKASAEGQFTIAELSAIYEILGKKL